jgi:hypothetical protein
MEGEKKRGKGREQKEREEGERRRREKRQGCTQRCVWGSGRVKRQVEG